MKRPIITLKDGIEVIGTTGDLDAFTHGGGVVFRARRPGGIFWSFWDRRELGQKNFDVYTAPVPVGVIEYFSPDLKELSMVTGMNRRDLETLGASKNPLERLQMVEAIRECCGASRVDPSHEPKVMSYHEISKRWGPVFGVDSDAIPPADEDDFIVRETVSGEYECGGVDGLYLGRHSEYRHALSAIADCMRDRSAVNSNVFHEHERGVLELVAWDPKTFVGKGPKRRGKLPVAKWQNSMKWYAELIRSASCNHRNSGVMSGRAAAKSRIESAERLERAREIRRSMEEIYGV